MPRRQIISPLLAPVILLAMIVTAGFSEEPASSDGPAAAFSQASFRLAAVQWLTHSTQREPLNFGIELDPNAAQAAAEKPLVILIHGFHSAPEHLAALAATIRQAGYPCGALRYPNDQPIADSAALLSQELRRLAKEQPGRKIVLLTHSMGGLVARQAIETPALNPGNVSQLMMIAPPTHGTSCAFITLSSDLWEHRATASQRTLLDCLVATGDAAHGEARDDLKPGSAFLERLNTQTPNHEVRYTVFLGTGAAVSPWELTCARQFVALLSHVDRFVAAATPLVERVLSDFEDSVAPGDGVVSVARGRLDGVSDTVLLGFDHWNVIRPALSPPVAELHRQILNRLSSELLVHNQNPAPK